MSVPVKTPSQAKPPAKRNSLPVNRRNKAAIDAMVWQGLKRAEAAETAGLTDHALYVALSKPHVRAYYMQQLDVLRTSERARNIHALVSVRDQDDNKMARVAAVKALEQLSDDERAAGSSSSVSPGVVIQIVTGGPQPPVIDVSPASEPLDVD